MANGLPQILREYGQAFGGDWSPSIIDGRDVNMDMDDIADWIENPNNYPGDDTARMMLNLCSNGKGHWAYPYCKQLCKQ